MEYKCKTYINNIHYSRYLAVLHLPTYKYVCRHTNMYAVVAKMKVIFAHWGIPDYVVSDNGPQFPSR